MPSRAVLFDFDGTLADTAPDLAAAVNRMLKEQGHDMLPLERVPDPAGMVAACARLVRPGGRVFFSTINRNPKSYLFAVVGAEYVLGLLPKGTHDYQRFIKPSELSRWTRDAGLRTGA